VVCCGLQLLAEGLAAVLLRLPLLPGVLQVLLVVLLFPG